jgi:exodeoxyribonuclease III
MPIVASWNVNSLNVRLPQLLAWLHQAQPDIVGLQETKLTDDKFPRTEVEEAGYHVIYTGQKTYNGVALLSKTPPTDIVTSLPNSDDEQRRFIAATIGGMRIINVYVPNGQAIDSDKYRYKLTWINALHSHLAEALQTHTSLAIMGDFNIAPADDDVHDPAAWKDQILCSPAEREALVRIRQLGLDDTFRRFEQAPQSFSWWDYRAAGFRRNLGLRIDLILASHPLAARCTKAWIDVTPRRQERPSDHTPVLATFDAPG